MCGIVGLTGSVGKRIGLVLKRRPNGLEYRGYDSASAAIANGGIFPRAYAKRPVIVDYDIVLNHNYTIKAGPQ